MEYYAHSEEGKPESEWQTLEEHLISVARLTQKFAMSFWAGECGRVAGSLHDLGKYSQEFQDYLVRSNRGEQVRRGEVIHALQGAKFIRESIKDYVISDIIGNIIASHHGGLFDDIIEGERTLSVRTDKDEEKLHYLEVVNKFSPKINETTMRDEIKNFCRISYEKKLNTFFMLHLLTKAVFSCVIDADRCDSAGLEVNEVITDWGRLIGQLKNYLDGFHAKSNLDKIRQRISEQCKQGSFRQQGIYTLSVPTGGGKTLSSLRFALEHAKQHKLKRIIYVIPYLSILDQTAAMFSEVFENYGNDLIFEHHSNIEPSEDDDEAEEYSLLASRWDSPIILTTMVQFLESIYSNKASKLRKFHNMADSVLIFDEVQALPVKCIHLFNDAINFLNTFGKSTVLLCTATQPHLHKTDRPVMLSDNPEVVSLKHKDLNIFKRVHIEDMTQRGMEYKEIAEFAKKQINLGKSTLVILNTKRDAKEIFEQCKSIQCEKAFLTTDLCPAHRLNILEEIRKNLGGKIKKITLCVSTQLIEAGVDISFDCVIRAAAGMDSIIQAAGRCNRNREHSEQQSVFIINVKDEKLSRLPEIKDGKSDTARVFNEKKGDDLLNWEVINLYYKYHFYGQKNKMDYNSRNEKTTIYNLLAENILGTGTYKNRNSNIYTGLPAAFRTAAEEFSVIDGEQIGIVVPYGSAAILADEFKESYDSKNKLRILRKLQKYTVSVYSNSAIFKKLKEEHAITLVDDSFYLLRPNYYDSKEKGLLLEGKFEVLCV